jgi:iron complex outermembrane receptor protein
MDQTTVLGCVVVAGVLGLAAPGSQVSAQEATGAEPAPPAEGTVELPKVTVETAPTKKAPSKKSAQVKKAPSTSAPAPAAESASRERAGTTETATGPVNGYNATRSATGIKTDTPLKEIPQSVSVVTADRIQDQGSKTVQEALRYVPGVYADAYGPDSRGDFPRVRGSDPDVYLDGLRVADVWRFGETRIDPYTLERIEVLRGPASVLYGQSAVAGILNLVSKRPQEQPSGEIGFEYGSFERAQVQMDMTGKATEDGKWLYRFTAVGRDSETQTDFVDDDRVLLAPSLTWKPTSSTSLTVLGRYQNDESGSSTAFLPQIGTRFPGYKGRTIPIERFASEPGFDKYDVETASVSTLFEHKFSDALVLRQNMRYLHTDAQYHTMYPDVSTLSPDLRTVERTIWMQDMQRDNFAADTNLEAKFMTGALAHKLLVGFDHRRLYQSSQSAFDSDTTPFDLYSPVYNGITPLSLSADPDEEQTQSGLYVQDQLRLGPWIVVLGARHDWSTNSVDDGSPDEKVQETSYRAGIMYELPFGLTPYFSYAQSFNPQYAAGCATPCAPLYGELYEVGFKYQPSKALTINGAIYEMTEENRLTYGPIFASTLDEARTRGAELEVIAQLTPDLDVIGAYAYTDAQVVEGEFAGFRVPTVPEHQASLWGKYKFSMFSVNGFSVGAGVRYVGTSWDGLDLVSTPAVTLVDAMIGWENDSWRLQVNGTNLEDKEYLTTCLSIDRSDCFWGTRRTVIGSLTYKF